jgi:hypothetical protein
VEDVSDVDTGSDLENYFKKLDENIEAQTQIETANYHSDSSTSAMEIDASSQSYLSEKRNQMLQEIKACLLSKEQTKLFIIAGGKKCMYFQQILLIECKD